MATRRKAAEAATSPSLKKPSRGTRPFLSESVRFTAQAAATFWGGLAESVAQAFDTLRRELEPENVADVGISDGLVEGVLAGNARFFEGMAETSRELLDETRDWRPQEPSRTHVVIDYEHLAKLVADELQKRPHHDSA
jgi:hypothetical protein